MKTIKGHIFRHSDSHQLFCGAEYTKPEPHDDTCALLVSRFKEACDCQVVEDCRECLAAQKAKRESQVAAARKAIEARNARQSQFSSDFEIYD